MVLVGFDLAATVAGLALPPRSDIYLLGPAGTEDQLAAWSMPLRATVITLPSGSRWLAQVVSGSVSSHGPVIAIVPGAGGVGASTLAAGLALAAQRRGPAALLDLDFLGGGLDLVVGAEAEPGWRWDTLRSATGQVADLSGRLPTVDGLAVVAASRTDRRDPPAEAVSAVIDGLARTGAVVVADVGRAASPARDEAIRAATRLVTVCGQSVRSVAATTAVLADLTDRRVDVVVRTDRSGAIAPSAVADALGCSLLASLPTLPGLTLLADRGLPPGRLAGRRWARLCRQIIDQLIGPTGPSPATDRRSR
jgi:secretion/DNA translocation related CpaE-like protein